MAVRGGIYDHTSVAVYDSQVQELLMSFRNTFLSMNCDTFLEVFFDARKGDQWGCQERLEGRLGLFKSEIRNQEGIPMSFVRHFKQCSNHDNVLESVYVLPTQLIVLTCQLTF